MAKSARHTSVHDPDLEISGPTAPAEGEIFYNIYQLLGARRHETPQELMIKVKDALSDFHPDKSKRSDAKKVTPLLTNFMEILQEEGLPRFKEWHEKWARNLEEFWARHPEGTEKFDKGSNDGWMVVE
jgi:hypothetical protein